MPSSIPFSVSFCTCTLVDVGVVLMTLDMWVEIMLTILRTTMILKLPAGPICVVSIPRIDQVLHLVLLQQLLQVCGFLVPEVSRLVGCFVWEGCRSEDLNDSLLVWERKYVVTSSRRDSCADGERGVQVSHIQDLDRILFRV